LLAQTRVFALCFRRVAGAPRLILAWALEWDCLLKTVQRLDSFSWLSFRLPRPLSSFCKFAIWFAGRLRFTSGKFA
jgi:hypothetical protein